MSWTQSFMHLASKTLIYCSAPIWLPFTPRLRQLKPSNSPHGWRATMDDCERYFPDRCIECPALLSEMTCGDRCAECLERARWKSESVNEAALALQRLAAG